MKNNFFSLLRNTLMVFVSIFSFSTFYGQQSQVQIGAGCLLEGSNDLNGWTVGRIGSTNGFPTFGVGVVNLYRAGHYIQSPIMDVSDFANMQLFFQMQALGATTTNERKVSVSISINGGPFIIQGEPFDNNLTTPISLFFDVDNKFSLTDVFQIRLSIDGTSNTSTTGSGLSNIKILGIQKAIWESGGWRNSIFPSVGQELPGKILQSASVSDLLAPIGVGLSTLTFDSLLITNGSVLTIDSGNSLVLLKGFSSADGSIIVENNANFIQSSDIINDYPITLNRNTSPLKRLDYVLWSSPVADLNLQEFSPETLPNRFYTYNYETDYYNSIDPVENIFNFGESYLIRTPDNFPSVPTIWEQSFNGIPNNGYYEIPVLSEKYYALGNPYPSDLNLDYFAENNALAGPFYFWRKTNNSANPSYASYMPGVGGVANNGSGINQTTPGDPNELVPNGICPPGQGFIVKTTPSDAALSDDPSYVIEFVFFDNSFRVSNDPSDVFLRNSATNIIKNRLWLNLSNVSGLFSQALVAYTSNSTLGLDSKDALVSGATPSSAILSSVINNQPNYVIQARGDFNEFDAVLLSLKAPVAGDYTISLANFDGAIFEDVDQEIYLKDNYTNTITNLKVDSYTFATNIGEFLDRFEIVYQNSFLNNDDFNANTFIVYSQDENNIVINGGNQILSSIKIFDTRGRLLKEDKNINTNEFMVGISSSSQLLLVQITNDNGQVFTKKIIH